MPIITITTGDKVQKVTVKSERNFKDTYDAYNISELELGEDGKKQTSRADQRMLHRMAQTFVMIIKLDGKDKDGMIKRGDIKAGMFEWVQENFSEDAWMELEDKVAEMEQAAGGASEAPKAKVVATIEYP